MARPKQVSDAEIRQACVEAQAAGKPLSIRAIFAVTGGDTKRIGRILDEFRAQQNLDPLAAVAPAGPVKPEDLPEAVKKPVLASAVPVYQAAINAADARNAQYLEETRQARDDRDFALNLHSQALKDLEATEDALAQEKQDRLHDQQHHADALRQAQDNFVQQLADVRQDFKDQLDALQKQVADMNSQIQTLTGEKTKADSAANETAQKLTDAQTKLQAAQVQIGDLIVAKAQAEGAKTILESREKAGQVMNEQLAVTMRLIQEQITRQTEIMARYDQKSEQVDALAEQVSLMQEMMKRLMPEENPGGGEKVTTTRKPHRV